MGRGILDTHYHRKAEDQGDAASDHKGQGKKKRAGNKERNRQYFEGEDGYTQQDFIAGGEYPHRVGNYNEQKYDNGIEDLYKDLLKEVIDKLDTYIWETALQKQTRLEGEYNRLRQGALSHADFRAL